MKIFYCWQSDLKSKFNRNFIKEAIEESIKELNADLGIIEPERQIKIDHDTKNVPGTPDLANIIFEKISSSTVFIADISFVASSEGDSTRKVANPNVLIELGYAFSKLGSERIVCVLNTSSGSVDKLPFNLQHKRHPIQYHLDSDSTDKKKQKANLVTNLKRAIKNILDMRVYGKTNIELPANFGDKDITQTVKFKKQPFSLPINPSKDDIFNIIMASDPKNDWTWAKNAGSPDKEIRYFKHNVNLRFESANDKSDVVMEDFREPWANCHPDPKATSYQYHCYFGSTIIYTFILVSVDGGWRARLPLPKSREELVVSPLDYKVAQIHDQQLNSLDEYMSRSGLRVEGNTPNLN